MSGVTGLFDGDGLSPREPLPRYLAPLPVRVENLALNLAWAVVAINLLGAVFGFYFYLLDTRQLLETPIFMWPWVPDSPLAALLAAGAFTAYARGNPREWLNALAFFGNLTLGLWTPTVMLVYHQWYAPMDPLMYAFLVVSHLAMAAQALVIHRFSDFPVGAVALALAWYASDLVVDFFVPLGGRLHHTWVPMIHNDPGPFGTTALDVMAVVATLLLVLATFLALAIRIEKLKLRGRGRPP